MAPGLLTKKSSRNKNRPKKRGKSSKAQRNRRAKDESKSYQRSLENDFLNNDEAEELEKKYVFQVYDEIADHFSSTRYKAWPRVADFLRKVTPGSLILDVGCGNGKNMNISNGCFEIGCDASMNLAKFCAQKSEVLVADCLLLPFRDNCADVIICIAVIHHMSTKERRLKALQEIVRVLRPKGKCLVYVWAMVQEGKSGPSAYLKKTLPMSAYNVEEIKFSNLRTIQVPIHINRTRFCQEDLLVPYKAGSKEKHRFYHLFQQKELESLITDCGSHLLSSYYDEGNWCAVFEK